MLRIIRESLLFCDINSLTVCLIERERERETLYGCVVLCRNYKWCPLF